MSCYTRAVQALHGRSSPDLEVHLHALIATERARRGEIETARTELEACFNYWDAKGHSRWIAAMCNRLSQVAIDAGDGARAAGCAEQSLLLYRSVGDTLGIADAGMHLGRARLLEGRRNEARALLDTAYRAYSDMGVRPRQARAQAVITEAGPALP